MGTVVDVRPGAQAPARPIQVVVVDDQQLLREGISLILQTSAEIEVVGNGSNGEDAIALAETLRPDVMLLDIRMPVLDGIQAIREIKSRVPGVRVIILTSYVYDGYVIEGMLAGADGYVIKDTTPAALISSVIAVAHGGQVIEPRVGRHIAQLLSKQSSERNQHYDGLTSRELQLLTMLARGSAAKEIAHSLHVSEKTVRNHVSNIYHKLGIYDRSQVVLYAIRKGLVTAD